MTAMVDAGLGVTLVPAWLNRANIEFKLAFKSVAEITAKMDYCLAFRKDEKGELLGSFIRLVKTCGHRAREPLCRCFAQDLPCCRHCQNKGCAGGSGSQGESRPCRPPGSADGHLAEIWIYRGIGRACRETPQRSDGSIGASSTVQPAARSRSTSSVSARSSRIRASTRSNPHTTQKLFFPNLE